MSQSESENQSCHIITGGLTSIIQDRRCCVNVTRSTVTALQIAHGQAIAWLSPELLRLAGATDRLPATYTSGWHAYQTALSTVFVAP